MVQTLLGTVEAPAMNHHAGPLAVALRRGLADYLRVVAP